jgi:hypothetical protein
MMINDLNTVDVERVFYISFEWGIGLKRK